MKGEGSAEVAKAALTLAQRKSLAPKPLSFDPKLEETLSMIQKQIAGSCDPNNLRWFAIKLFERDEKAMEQLNLSAAVLDQIEALRQEAEREFIQKSQDRFHNILCETILILQIYFTLLL